MTEEMTHDRCSELLPSLLAGRLSADEALEVEDHLEGCTECRIELRGLTALADDLTPLTDFERVKLRRAVRSSLPAASEPRASVWSKAAPFISVAAALLILGFGLTSLDLGGMDSSDESAGSAADAGGSDTEAEGSAGSSAVEDDQGTTSAAGGGGTGGGSEEAASDIQSEVTGESLEAAEPESGDSSAGFSEDSAMFKEERYPVYRFGGRIVPENLESQAQSGRIYRSAARDLKPKNAERDGEELLATLRGHAEKSGRSGEDLATCAQTVTDSSSAARLPVFATFGKLESRPSLAIGFIEGEGSTYNRYLIGIWSPPSDCTDPRLLKGPLR